jgi:hypothetical protein
MKTIRAILIFVTVLLSSLGRAQSSVECNDLRLTGVTACAVTVGNHEKYTETRIGEDHASVRTISAKAYFKLWEDEATALKAEKKRLAADPECKRLLKAFPQSKPESYGCPAKGENNDNTH